MTPAKTSNGKVVVLALVLAATSAVVASSVYPVLIAPGERKVSNRPSTNCFFDRLTDVTDFSCRNTGVGGCAKGHKCDETTRGVGERVARG